MFEAAKLALFEQLARILGGALRRGPRADDPAIEAVEAFLQRCFGVAARHASEDGQVLFFDRAGGTLVAVLTSSGRVEASHDGGNFTFSLAEVSTPAPADAAGEHNECSLDQVASFAPRDDYGVAVAPAPSGDGRETDRSARRFGSGSSAPEAGEAKGGGEPTKVADRSQVTPPAMQPGDGEDPATVASPIAPAIEAAAAGDGEAAAPTIVAVEGERYAAPSVGADILNEASDPGPQSGGILASQSVPASAAWPSREEASKPLPLTRGGDANSAIAGAWISAATSAPPANHDDAGGDASAPLVVPLALPTDGDSADMRPFGQLTASEKVPHRRGPNEEGDGRAVEFGRIFAATHLTRTSGDDAPMHGAAAFAVGPLPFGADPLAIAYAIGGLGAPLAAQATPLAGIGRAPDAELRLRHEVEATAGRGYPGDERHQREQGEGGRGQQDGRWDWVFDLDDDTMNRS